MLLLEREAAEKHFHSVVGILYLIAVLFCFILLGLYTYFPPPHWLSLSDLVLASSILLSCSTENIERILITLFPSSKYLCKTLLKH